MTSEGSQRGNFPQSTSISTATLKAGRFAKRPAAMRGSFLTSRPVLARVLSIAATFALSAIVARELGVDSAGRFFVIFTVITVAATVSRFGTDNLALKIVAANPTSRTTVRVLFLICIATSVIVSVFLAGITPLLLDLTHGLAIPVNSAEVAVVAVPPMALSVLAGAVLRGRGRVAYGTLAELGSTPVLAGIGIWVAAHVTHMTLGKVLCILVVASVVTVAWSIPVVFHCSRVERRNSEPRLKLYAYLRSNHRALVSMMGTSVLFYLITWSPLFALAAVSTSRQVSYFAVSARIAAFIALIPAIQTSYLAPRFATLHANGRISELNRLCAVSTKRAALIAAVPAILITASPARALAIFGSDFTDAAQVLRVLCISGLLVVAFGQVNSLMLTCGFEHVAFALNLAAAVASLVMALIAAELFGATGVAVVSAFGATMYALIAAAVLQMRGGIRSSAGLPPRPRRADR